MEKRSPVERRKDRGTIRGEWKELEEFVAERKVRRDGDWPVLLWPSPSLPVEPLSGGCEQRSSYVKL